jgi:hypothetical protein
LKVLLIKAAISAASSKKGRKIIIGAACGVLGLIVLPMFLFAGILSGLFAFFMNTKHEAEWARIMSHLEQTFSGIGANIEDDIREEVYNFMPEFSVNLSKATIAESFNNFLLLYDSDEVERAYNDESYMPPSYLYEIYETEDENGKITKTQILTVDNGEGYSEIVEYRQIGGGVLYAPELLAMFQARQMGLVINEDMTDEESAQLAKDMETAFKELPDDGEVPAEFTDDVWNGLNDSGRQKNVGLLGIFQTNSLMALLRDSIKDGNVSARTEYEWGEDYSKLIVILEMPSFDEWGDIFELDDNQRDIAEESEWAIKQILDDAGVPEDERYISLDDKVQAALFVYFQGFFNLPVERSALTPGNGILTTLGDKETIHRYGRSGTYGVYERGVTLELNAANIPVKLELLPVGDCIKEVYIFDVCENTPEYIDKNETCGLFHYPAITLAFVIDLRQFYYDYGFHFPTVRSDNGKMLGSSDIVTLYLEFSCLDRLAYGISERSVGQRLDLYSEAEPFTIGYAHNGQPSDIRGDLSPAVGAYTHHLDPRNPTPYICIKMAFSSGYPNIINWYEDFGATRGGNRYRNMRFNNVGEVFVNPLMWFKSFRTDLRGVAPIIPK